MIGVALHDGSAQVESDTRQQTRLDGAEAEDLDRDIAFDSRNFDRDRTYDEKNQPPEACASTSTSPDAALPYLRISDPAAEQFAIDA